MLFALLTGHFPWEASDMLNLFDAIIHEPLHIPSYLSYEVSDLLGKMLAKNPHERLTAEQIFDHPWLAPCKEEPSIVKSQVVSSTPPNATS